MTRKDYVLIANAIRNSNDGNVVHVVIALAAALSNDNIRFDKERFLTACGV